MEFQDGGNGDHVVFFKMAKISKRPSLVVSYRSQTDQYKSL